MFAQLNYEHFAGEIPTYRIAYNERFSNTAGRITYRPPTIELSPKHFRKHPELLRETLLHEMIHAWLHSRKLDSGHGPAFKKKMRELGLTSIYHDMGRAAPLAQSTKRFILRCPKCAVELLRRRKPPSHTSCGRCSARRYDARFRFAVFEIVQMRAVEG